MAGQFFTKQDQKSTIDDCLKTYPYIPWLTPTWADIFWRIMIYPDVTPTYPNVSWRILMYPDVSWHILTYPDVFWRILTYPDVSWRILTCQKLSLISLKYPEISFCSRPGRIIIHSMFQIREFLLKHNLWQKYFVSWHLYSLGQIKNVFCLLKI